MSTHEEPAGGEKPAESVRDLRAEFRSLYERSLSGIYRFVVRSLPLQRGDADDLVADIYLVAWRRINDVPEPPEDVLWVYGVARNVISQHRRAAGRKGNLAHALASQRQTPTFEVELDTRVLEAIENLPVSQHEVIQLVTWEGMSLQDAALVLGCSTNAVKVRLHRAKRMLRSRMGIPEPIQSNALEPKVTEIGDV